MRTSSLPKTLLILLALSLLLFGLPLLGVVLNGGTIAPYLEFPPQTRFVEHAPFSWGAFALMGLIAAASFAALYWMLQPGRRVRTAEAAPERRFPVWGWLGLIWLGGTWALAWSPLNEAWGLASYSFVAIWLGYIVMANALTQWRSGHSLLADRPGVLAVLFPFSALFWWYFEYLNRFVQNWHYVDIASPTTQSYVLHATLAFSTVLPAVMSTMLLLKTFPGLSEARRTAGFSHLDPRRLGWATLWLGAVGLLGIGVWPNQLYALVWAAPPLVLLALQALAGERTWLHPLRQGRWDPIALPALAALVCGFLWETWNWHSAPKWVYSVPYVHRFEIFEMPLLGFTGYLPFGVACAVFADFALRLVKLRPEPGLEPAPASARGDARAV